MPATKFRNQQELLQYIDNPVNYKLVRSKRFELWACMPPVDFSYRIAGNLVVFTMQAKRFVLYDWEHKFHVVSLNTLASICTMPNGNLITPVELRSMCVGDTIEWFKVLMKPDVAKLFAIHVPAQYKISVQGQYGCWLMVNNDGGGGHGSGDFLVCDAINNQPNMQTRRLIKGAAFPQMFNNQGWTDCIDHRYLTESFSKPPDLFKSVEYVKDSGISDKSKQLFFKLFKVRELEFHDKGICYGGNDYDDPEFHAKLVGENKVKCRTVDSRGNNYDAIKTIEEAAELWRLRHWDN